MNTVPPHSLQTSYQALMNQASKERTQHLQSEQDTYRDVTDLSTLLQRLNLEHYESCFQQEEVDLDTFLTMSEADLKEVGITTLGARRKLQIAISGKYHTPAGGCRLETTDSLYIPLFTLLQSLSHLYIPLFTPLQPLSHLSIPLFTPF